MYFVRNIEKNVYSARAVIYATATYARAVCLGKLGR